ncbi:hypothetical protein DUNSADRAFT_11268 [Dunaliella salina]|uniref:Secreted protein n=1 Tax=Dunaliella salina TaxID=3046 RepID=A0ABQ7GDR5_DUNSA|nr:hypothetical protein DUNSADRAFT_11268 [Dunaliella salina]|eukprot:KAF5832749.1 hypothetical protein DUNSADRAFT_11268 [Dunaliella salina]
MLVLSLACAHAHENSKAVSRWQNVFIWPPDKQAKHMCSSSACACAAGASPDPGLPAWHATSHPHTAHISAHAAQQACFHANVASSSCTPTHTTLGQRGEGMGSKMTKHAHKKEHTHQTCGAKKNEPVAGGSHRLYYGPGACGEQLLHPPYKCSPLANST